MSKLTEPDSCDHSKGERIESVRIIYTKLKAYMKQVFLYEYGLPVFLLLIQYVGPMAHEAATLITQTVNITWRHGHNPCNMYDGCATHVQFT